MTLSPQEFMRRFLLHVLPGGFHRIRHYGLLANGSRKACLAAARELLLTLPVPTAAAMPWPSCRPSPRVRRSAHLHRHDRLCIPPALGADDRSMLIGKVGACLQHPSAELRHCRAPQHVRRSTARDRFQPGRVCAHPSSATTNHPAAAQNPNSVSALNTRCGLLRSFLPRGLCDTCPPAVVVHRSVPVSGQVSHNPKQDLTSSIR